MKRFRRVGVAGVAFALLSGFASVLAVATPAGATPIPPGTSTCTYTDTTAGGTGSQTGVTGVSPGDTINVNCTGLPTTAAPGLVLASPLAGVPGDGSQTAFADLGTLTTCPNTAGAINCNFTIPASFTASDPSAKCPPTQAQIDAGLVGCAIAVADTISQSGLNQGLVVYAGTTADPPTASLSYPAGFPGETLNVTGSGWYGGGIFGVPNSAANIPGFTTLFGASTLATNTLTATPPTYCVATTTAPTTGPCAGVTTSTFTPPVFGGTITIPATASGPTAISIIEPNASGLGGTTVSLQKAFNVLGSPSIQVTPLHGGQGVPVSVSGSNFDPQGSTASVSFNAGSPTADSVSGIAVQPDGTFSATLVVGANEVAEITGTASSVSDPIDASQNPSVASGLTTLTTSTAFTVDGASAGPCATTGAPNTCKVNQVIQETVTGVTSGLIISEANAPTPCTVAGATNSADGIHLALQGVTLNGRAQTARGCLNTVQVEDARGTLVGWTTTGQLETDFLGPNVGSNTWDHVIPAQNLTWSPVRSLTYPTDPSGVLSEVAAGATGPLPTSSQSAGLNGAAGPYPAMNESSTPVDLCSAAPGGGGGTFNCDAGLALVVPAFVAAGPYQATLDLVIT